MDSTSTDAFDGDFRTAADYYVRPVPAPTPDPYNDPAYVTRIETSHTAVKHRMFKQAVLVLSVQQVEKNPVAGTYIDCKSKIRGIFFACGVLQG